VRRGALHGACLKDGISPGVSSDVRRWRWLRGVSRLLWLGAGQGTRFWRMLFTGGCLVARHAVAAAKE